MDESALIGSHSPVSKSVSSSNYTSVRVDSNKQLVCKKEKKNVGIGSKSPNRTLDPHATLATYIPDLIYHVSYSAVSWIRWTEAV